MLQFLTYSSLWILFVRGGQKHSGVIKHTAHCERGWERKICYSVSVSGTVHQDYRQTCIAFLMMLLLKGVNIISYYILDEGLITSRALQNIPWYNYEPSVQSVTLLLNSQNAFRENPTLKHKWFFSLKDVWAQYWNIKSIPH